MARSRIRWTLVVALAAHAAVWAWARQVPPPTRAFSASNAPPTEIDVSVESTPATERPPALFQPSEQAPDPARAEATPNAVRGPATPATPSTAGTAGHANGAAGVGDVITSAEPSSPEGGGWTFSPFQPGTPAAAGGAGSSADAFARATRQGVDAVVAQAAKEDEERARKRAIPLFSKRDIELGFAPGAHLAPLASDRVRRSNTPDIGHAVLEFRTDGAGIVASVRVVEASSGHADWNDVATALVTDAKSRPLRVPSGARGLIVTVDVTSSMRTVSGESAEGSSISKIGRAINNPLDTIVDSRTPPRRVVAARVVAVDLL